MFKVTICELYSGYLLMMDRHEIQKDFTLRTNGTHACHKKKSKLSIPLYHQIELNMM